jgi:hypothetical protein
MTSTNVTMMENSTTSEYICCLCHYPGTSSENLNAHITNMHAGMLRSNAAELTNSERQSTIEKEPPKNIAEPETTSKYIVDPINCNLCNYSGTSPDDLKAHVEISHGHMFQPLSKKPATRSQKRKAAAPTKRSSEDKKPEGKRQKSQM